MSRDRWLLVPLRAFLGLTFVYAGLQKLADKWFFKASAPSSLQAQLRAAARTSPVGGLMGPLQHHAVLVGLIIAFGELAVGVGTLLGLWTRVAAVGGAVLSFGFLLTVSWHSRPYYYGPDVVFLFAWTPLVIGGGGPLSLDAVAASHARGAPGLAVAGDELDRRAFLVRLGWAGWVAAASAMAGGVVALVGRSVASHGSGTASPTLPGLGTAPPPGGSAAGPPAVGSTTAPAPEGPTTAPTTVAPAASGTRIGAASAVPVGGAASYTDPGSGDPAFVVQPTAGSFVSFDATCPHQGCPVEFGGSIFQCPCHGAQFDAHTGAVLRGPATQPLAPITIREGPDGQLYVGK